MMSQPPPNESPSLCVCVCVCVITILYNKTSRNRPHRTNNCTLLKSEWKYHSQLSCLRMNNWDQTWRHPTRVPAHCWSLTVLVGVFPTDFRYCECAVFYLQVVINTVSISIRLHKCEVEKVDTQLLAQKKTQFHVDLSLASSHPNVWKWSVDHAWEYTLLPSE
jgi:hypothetical protein